MPVFFSIISICRNNLLELQDTHQSILEQTINDFEWIVIDGNSSDGTSEWLKTIPNANWVSENDEGIYDAMNKGLAKASGTYCIFMNSGDKFATKDVLEKTKNRININNNPGFVYGDSIDISEDGNQFYRKAKSHEKNHIGMITQHQAMIFNKEIIGNQTYLLDYPLSADYAFISSILRKVENSSILYLNFPVCKFSMGGLNEQRRFKAMKEDFSIRKNIMGLSLYMSSALFALHFLHATIKKALPSARFIKHESATEINDQSQKSL